MSGVSPKLVGLPCRALCSPASNYFMATYTPPPPIVGWVDIPIFEDLISRTSFSFFSKSADCFWMDSSFFLMLWIYSSVTVNETRYSITPLSAGLLVLLLHVLLLQLSLTATSSSETLLSMCEFNSTRTQGRGYVTHEHTYQVVCSSWKENRHQGYCWLGRTLNLVFVITSPSIVWGSRS